MQGSIALDGLAGQRVGEAQAVSVQRLSAYPGAPQAVHLVSNDGVAHMRQVQPDLVGAPSLGVAADQRSALA